MRPFARNERVPSSPSDDDRVAVGTEKRLRETPKTAKNGVFVKVFSTYFYSPWLNAWVLISRGHDLVVLAKSSSGCFPCRQCQTSTLWGGLKLCTQLCRVVYTFCRCYWCFCRENPAGRGLFRRNSRKPLALAENNVYFSVHEQFKPCQGNSSNSTWSLGLRKRDGSDSSPDDQCIDLAFLCYSSFFVLSSFFFFFHFFFATKGDLDCKQMIESSL